MVGEGQLLGLAASLATKANEAKHATTGMGQKRVAGIRQKMGANFPITARRVASHQIAHGLDMRLFARGGVGGEFAGPRQWRHPVLAAAHGLADPGQRQMG